MPSNLRTMDRDTYLLIGSVALILAFILLLPILTFRFEKHMVWNYGEPEGQPQRPHPYMESCVAAAMQAGFSFLGWARDLRGGIYKVNHALLVSPDRTTIAVITAGFLVVPLEGICLYTPTADGRAFYTTNSQYFVQIDVSRNWTSQLALAPTFAKLWQRHQAWLQEMAVPPRPFARSGRELEDFRVVRGEHCRSMAAAGLIRYIDASASRWQYTLYGAIKTAMRSLAVRLARRFTLGQFPRTT
jgi:hypothetical protein